MIFIVVIPVVLAVGLFIWSVAGVIADIKRHTKIGIKYCVALAASLAVLDAVFCLAVSVAAGLSHSAAAIAQADTMCAVSFLVLVALPVAGLLLYRSRQPTPPDPQ